MSKSFTLRELELWKNTNSLVVYDLETTGFSYASGNRIIDIGAYELNGDTIVSKFETLVNPGVNIPSNIEELTGITNNMVKWKISEREAIIQFNKYLEGKVVCCHNAKFDFDNFTKGSVRNHLGIELENESICTLRAARKFVKNSKCDLDTIYRYLIKKTPELTHRAYADSMLTVELYYYMKEFFNRNYDEIREMLEKEKE